MADEIIWNIGRAPEGVALRAKVRASGEGSRGARNIELCFLLVRQDGRWHYARTMVPVYCWHEPVAWSQTPRLVKDLESFQIEINRAYGSSVLPSGVRAA